MYMLTNHTHLLLAETGGGRSLKGNSVEAKETGAALGGMRCGKYVGGGHIAMEWKGTKKHTHIRNTQVNNGALLTIAAKQRTVITTNNCICA